MIEIGLRGSPFFPTGRGGGNKKTTLGSFPTVLLFVGAIFGVCLKEPFYAPLI